LFAKKFFHFFDAGGCLRADFSGVSGRRSIWHSPENKKQMIFKKVLSWMTRNFVINGGMNDEDEYGMAQGRYSIRCDGRLQRLSI
jgi:hypothetical protein